MTTHKGSSKGRISNAKAGSQPEATKSLPLIKPLGIKLNMPTEDDYEKAKREYIANFTEYRPGGFLSIGTDIHNPEAGRAKWDSKYLDGFDSWVSYRGDHLTTTGQKALINKINELVKLTNELAQRFPQTVSQDEPSKNAPEGA